MRMARRRVAVDPLERRITRTIRRLERMAFARELRTFRTRSRLVLAGPRVDGAYQDAWGTVCQATCIVMSIPGYKVLLNQLGFNPPHPMGCWATVYTMMISWRAQQSFDITRALGRVGPYYQKLFELDAGLSQADALSFLRAAGMHHEPMVNLKIEGYFHLMKKYGLLWVSTRPGETSLTHSRIIEGIRVVDLADGHAVSFAMMDPWGGRRYHEPFSTFVRRYEGAFKDHHGAYYQIRHF